MALVGTIRLSSFCTQGGERQIGVMKNANIYIYTYHKMPRKYASIFHFHVCFQLLAFQKAGLGGLCLLFFRLKRFSGF